ncbi:hypothetical protein INT48_001792 [Thamnidium elegans]|uniref:Uncharacterized protein n=1 Tax=Thamnidium elegans TaxID=101142 RepID=A0A8H7SV99_9FUNG|nr:hypothetical protein INT48_001792 [Thamnidium elegans]
MLQKHLSGLLIATGIQFSKAAFLVSQENIQSHRYTYVLADCQLHTKILRRQHQLTCQMLGLAQMEPRITKDTFPIQVYGQILEHEQHIYSGLSSLRTKSSLPTSLPSVEIARKLLQQRQAILWHENFDELCQITKDGETMVDEDVISKRKA